MIGDLPGQFFIWIQKDIKRYQVGAETTYGTLTGSKHKNRVIGKYKYSL